MRAENNEVPTWVGTDRAKSILGGQIIEKEKTYERELGKSEVAGPRSPQRQTIPADAVASWRARVLPGLIKTRDRPGR
jgi:hypothetical protein